MKRFYVGLAGVIGAGKSTVAVMIRDCLAESLIEAEIRSFADGVRQSLLAIDPLVNSDSGETIRLGRLIKTIGWDRAKREWPEVRRLLRAVGTEGGRDIHGEDCWIRREAEGATRDVVVFDDMRFPNELEFVNGRGISIWVEKKDFLSGGVTDSHRSESYHELLKSRCTFLVTNDFDDTAKVWKRVREIAELIVQKAKERK